MGSPEWASNVLPPDLKMHALLKLAMDDLEKTWREIDAGEPVKIDMGDWFYAEDDYSGGTCKRVCEVCFAGSVMHHSLSVPIHGEGFRRSVALPHMFDTYTCRCLRALNRLRVGEIGRAYNERDVPRVPHAFMPTYVTVTIYMDTPTGRERFKADMLKIHDLLLRFDP